MYGVGSLRAVKYKVKVFGSVLEWSHGMGRTIEEMFIPEMGITLNIVDDELHVFKGERERSNEEKEEIEVSDDLVKLLETYLKIKEECQNRIKHLMKHQSTEP